MKTGVHHAIGRRKEAVARVRLVAGSGNITVNKLPLLDFLKRETLKMIVEQPFEVTETMGKYDVFANVKGGGLSGQAGAIRLGIARALQTAEEELRPTLKSAGLLRRDPRMIERKKYGQPGARKRFQFSKR